MTVIYWVNCITPLLDILFVKPGSIWIEFKIKVSLALKMRKYWFSQACYKDYLYILKYRHASTQALVHEMFFVFFFRWYSFLVTKVKKWDMQNVFPGFLGGVFCFFSPVTVIMFQYYIYINNPEGTWGWRLCHCHSSLHHHWLSGAFEQ